jgi:hypothetical protein
LSGVKVTEVKVNHHARQFGQSKYGLSRIYKVLLDLLTIKTILSLGQHPVRWLVKISIFPFMISYLILMLSFGQSIDINVVLSSLVVIFFSLGVFLISLGMLVELVYFKGNFSIQDVSTFTNKSSTEIRKV